MTETTDNKVGFAVVDWDTTFEVDDKGGPWKPEKPFRRGPLSYLRWPTTGTFARRIAMIGRVAGSDAVSIRGMLLDLVALVASLDRPGRIGGVIRRMDSQPASLEDIAESLGEPAAKVSRAVDVLTDRRVGLLQVVTPNTSGGTRMEPPDDKPDSGGFPETPEDSPESSGNLRPLSGNPLPESGPGSGAEQGRAAQEQIKGNAKASPEGSASALSSFDCLLSALRTAYSDNPTIRNFASWLRQRYQTASPAKWKEVAELVNRLIAKSKAADGEPAAFFIGAVKKSPEDGGFGYQPRSKLHAQTQ